MTTYSEKTRRAIAKYGEETCISAYRYNLQGYGARSVALECVSGLHTTNQADAAINAGAEIVNTPLPLKA